MICALGSRREERSTRGEDEVGFNVADASLTVMIPFTLQNLNTIDLSDLDRASRERRFVSSLTAGRR